MFIKTFLIWITINLVYADHHVPHEKTNETSLAVQARLFKKLQENHLFVFEFTNFKQEKNQVFDFDISLRRKISRSVEYGLESALELNHRHDDDWIKDGYNWKWKDNNKDFTSSLFLKLKKDFYISKKIFIAGAKFRTENNWTKTLLTLIPELSLTYIHFKAGKHKFNIFAKTYMYIPLNYSSEDIYKKSAYIGMLLNYSKKVHPYFFIERQEITWTTSKEFKSSHQDDNYKQEHTNTLFGLGFNYYL